MTPSVRIFSYTYDAGGQRATETAPDAQRTFGYDALRQLTLATTQIGGSETDRHSYSYDGIRNRLTDTRSLANGAPAITHYTVNAANQYTSLMGARSDTPAYDPYGNTTSLRGMTLRYDEENQLIEISDATRMTQFRYDGLGRRVERLQYVDGSHVATTRFVYDGMRVVEELDTGYEMRRSYTLGQDLSHSFEGSGGVGGLLAVSTPSGGTFTAASYFYDGNGNVTELTSDSGTVVARYRYSPFGDVIETSGTFAADNTYRFSSKPQEEVSGFYYYGFRFYDSIVGRWLSRDPIGENGGINLYQYVFNNPINWIDALGLDVTVHSRDVSGTGGAGAHSWVEVSDSSGRSSYSGIKDANGNLGVRKDYPADFDAAKKGTETSKKLVPPPPGMTQAEWDKKVRESGEKELKKDGKRKYKLTGGDGGKKSGNCHTTTSDILEGAGGSVPKDWDPPGLDWGLRNE